MDEHLVSEFEAKDDAALREVVQRSDELSEALLMKMPELSQELGLDLFQPEWIRRYGKRILAEVSGQPVDLAFKWALGLTALQVAEYLSKHLNLSVAAWSSAIALAILLLRAARAPSK
jgi:hypothetical protein